MPSEVRLKNCCITRIYFVLELFAAVYILPVAALLLLAFLVWSCAKIDSGVWLKAVCRDMDRGRAALTFDDGPDPVITPQILDILAENDVKACFFVIGEKAEKYPELICRIAAGGHKVGNHTYTHSVLFPLAGKPCIEDEIRACDAVIDSALSECAELSAERREPVFRPPFGVTNPDIAKVVKYTGHKVIGWDVRSLDTFIVKDSLSDAEAAAAISRCVAKIISAARPGSVILLHDRLRHSPALLRALIPALRAKGLL